MASTERKNRIQIQDFLPELVELDEREQKAIVGGSSPTADLMRWLGQKASDQMTEAVEQAAKVVKS
jgi:hypothetical protein